jgi:hypothetical protein
MDFAVLIGATAAAYDASGGGGTISARGRGAALESVHMRDHGDRPIRGVHLRATRRRRRVRRRSTRQARYMPSRVAARISEVGLRSRPRKRCSSATTMQHSRAADGRVSSIASRFTAGCEQKSSSFGAAVQTAGAGSEAVTTSPWLLEAWSGRASTAFARDRPPHASSDPGRPARSMSAAVAQPKDLRTLRRIWLRAVFGANSHAVCARSPRARSGVACGCADQGCRPRAPPTLQEIGSDWRFSVRRPVSAQRQQRAERYRHCSRTGRPNRRSRLGDGVASRCDVRRARGRR